MMQRWHEMRADGWTVTQLILLALAYPWLSMVNNQASQKLFVGIWVCYLGLLAAFASKTVAIAGACIPMALLLASMASGAILATMRNSDGIGRRSK